MSYQPGIPTGSVPLNQDYLNLRRNFTALNNIFSQDHTPLPSNSNIGYHQSVHLVSQSTTTSNPPNNFPPVTPTVVTNVGQLFSASVNDGYNTGTALFYLTGAGNLKQLTSNFTPKVSRNGYTFLPGGITYQWGIVPIPQNASKQVIAVLFATSNRDFANNCFNIQTSLITRMSGSSSSNNTIAVQGGTVSKTGFTAIFNGEEGTYRFFAWTAIGN